MWIAIAMAVLAGALVLGPVMMVRPSGTQARLAKIRTTASQMGLQVSMVPKKELGLLDDKGKRGACYSLLFKQKLPPQPASARHWQLLKRPYEHAIHFKQQWDWGGSGRAPEVLLPEITALIDQLPEGVTGLTFSEAQVSCIWDERCGALSEQEAVGQVAAFLALAVTTIGDRLMTETL